MAKSEMGTILMIGAAGFGVYLAWPWLSSLIPGSTAGTTPAPAPTPTPTPTPSPVPAPTPSGSILPNCPSGLFPTTSGFCIPCGPGTMIQNNQCVPSTIPITGAGSPCASDPQGPVSFLQALAANGTDPTAVANQLGISAGCLAQLVGIYQAARGAMVAKAAAGLGAVRPTMTRAYRMNYLRRMA